jgi:hypothetical protein
MAGDGRQFAPALSVSLRLGIEDVKNALTGGTARLEDLVELMQAFDGILEEFEQQQEGGEITRSNFP